MATMPTTWEKQVASGENAISRQKETGTRDKGRVGELERISESFI